MGGGSQLPYDSPTIQHDKNYCYTRSCMVHLLHQLYKTKLRLAGLVTAMGGVGFLFVAKYVATESEWSWLASWPLSELGTTLLSAGVIAVIFEYYARKESEAIAAERFRMVIRQEAPAIRDVVLDSLAFNADTLKDVASPERLDQIATNAIGLRLEDEHLAHEVYTDLRDQVIQAPERWHDVDVSVTLSPWAKGPATGRGSMFVATIRWEYRVTPVSSAMRFACTGDHAEYREMLRDPAVTDPWYISRNGGLDAASQDVFELVQFTIDGKAKGIRRTVRPEAQLYTVNLGQGAAGKGVTVSYTYRILVQRHGHVLYLDFPRPVKGLHVQLNYAGAGIRRINTLDYIASNQQTRVDTTSDDSPAKTVDVGFDSWIFPRSGVAFVWVLSDELAEPSTP
jgi:hypothetical protein